MKLEEIKIELANMIEENRNFGTDSEKANLYNSANIVYKSIEWCEAAIHFNDAKFNFEEIKSQKERLNIEKEELLNLESALKKAKVELSNVDVDDDEAFNASREKVRDAKKEYEDQMAIVKDIQDLSTEAIRFDKFLVEYNNANSMLFEALKIISPSTKIKSSSNESHSPQKKGWVIEYVEKHPGCKVKEVALFGVQEGILKGDTPEATIGVMMRRYVDKGLLQKDEVSKTYTVVA